MHAYIHTYIMCPPIYCSMIADTPTTRRGGGGGAAGEEEPPAGAGP